MPSATASTTASRLSTACALLVVGYVAALRLWFDLQAPAMWRRGLLLDLGAEARLVVFRPPAARRLAAGAGRGTVRLVDGEPEAADLGDAAGTLAILWGGPGGLRRGGDIDVLAQRRDPAHRAGGGAVHARSVPRPFAGVLHGSPRSTCCGASSRAGRARAGGFGFLYGAARRSGWRFCRNITALYSGSASSRCWRRGGRCGRPCARRIPISRHCSPWRSRRR